MPAKTILYAVASLVVAALFGYSAIRGHTPRHASEWLAPIGPAVAAAAGGLWLFDRFAWRWPGIRHLVGRPILRGTWYGELASEWVNPQTGQPIPADPNVFLVVRQRYWQVSVRVLTKESSSASIVASFRADADGVQQLVYVYSNAPRPEVRHRSERHYGAAVLGAPRDPHDGLEGYYFTDRGTRGEMRFRECFKTLVETHTAGMALVEQPERLQRVDPLLPRGEKIVD